MSPFRFVLIAVSLTALSASAAHADATVRFGEVDGAGALYRALGAAGAKTGHSRDGSVAARSAVKINCVDSLSVEQGDPEGPKEALYFHSCKLTSGGQPIAVDFDDATAKTFYQFLGRAGAKKVPGKGNSSEAAEWTRSAQGIYCQELRYPERGDPEAPVEYAITHTCVIRL